MFVRLAYAMAGETPPDGALYAVPGMEDYRSAVGTDEDARRDPEGDAARYDYRFPARSTFRQRLSATHQRHPKIKGLFGSGVGRRLMHTESEIIVRVLLDLIGQGIVPLPLHDGLMVAQSVKGTATGAMRRGARDVAGVNLPIVEKRT
jgi:hypothetical protein